MSWNLFLYNAAFPEEGVGSFAECRRNLEEVFPGIVWSRASERPVRAEHPRDQSLRFELEMKGDQVITIWTIGGYEYLRELAHAGRKASTSRPWEGHGPLQPEEDGWEVVGPSDTPYPHEEPAPPTHALDREGIARVVDSFVHGAERALSAGFEIAEVHAAHGYLISSFISPLSNIRQDEYGGSLENRMRYPLEVFRAMRAAWVYVQMPKRRPTLRRRGTSALKGSGLHVRSICFLSPHVYRPYVK